MKDASQDAKLAKLEKTKVYLKGVPSKKEGKKAISLWIYF